MNAGGPLSIQLNSNQNECTTSLERMRRERSIPFAPILTGATNPLHRPLSRCTVTPMRVRAKADCHQELPDGRTNPSITAGREYVVVGCDSENYRLADDRLEPVLFERFLFDLVECFSLAQDIEVEESRRSGR